VNFDQWEGRYVAVTRDLGYDRLEDERAAKRLAELVAARRGPTAGDRELEALLAGQPVFVFAAGPTLESEIEGAAIDATVIAADAAAGRLAAREIRPHIIVTDLDGDMDAVLRANREGAIVVAHAHGDNIDLVEKFVPMIEGPLVATVQCAPPDGTRNFGGLTDGDRAVFLADHFGATRIVLAGFDFGDEAAFPLPPDKHRKFIWGALLIASLDNPAVMFFDESRAAGEAPPPA
jgi:uncharacterized Rossmann fold enzyme